MTITRGRKEAVQLFLLLLYLSIPAETTMLYSRQDFLFLFFYYYYLTGAKLPLTTDLSAQDEDRRYGADHSQRVRPEIKIIKYIQC